MKLRSLLPVLSIIALTALAACGFRPLYAENRTGQSTAVDMSKVHIALINDRVGQIARNALLETLTPRGSVSRPEYDLEINLDESISEQGYTKDNEATIAEYVVTANYLLTRRSDSRILREGSLRARTSFNIVDSDFATLEAEDAARTDAAHNLAHQIANQVAVGLRSAP
ncbi:LPS assembly lipoprotein LptE [Thalassospira sp. MA62]|nr:LPS assembly lipoprotein LptE [Thalassospira sp. MA62]